MALKRQQAAEDAIALGLRAISGDCTSLGYLPPGPVWGKLKAGENASESNDSSDCDDGTKFLREVLPKFWPKLEFLDEKFLNFFSFFPESTEAQPPAKKTKLPEPKMEVKKSPTDSKDTTIPNEFRPGHLNHSEILTRLFPYHRKEVIELVLQGCNGDVVKTIEHFLCASDSVTPNANEAKGKSKSETAMKIF